MMCNYQVTEECRIRRNGTIWNLKAFKFVKNGIESTVLAFFRNLDQQPVLVRVNSPCITSEVFGEEGRCDCRHQLNMSIRTMEKNGSGLLIYNMREEGMGNGIFNKINSYAIMDKEGLSTRYAYEKLGLNADARDYFYVGPILKHFSLSSIRLMTNNANKVSALKNCGIKVHRIPLVAEDSDLKAYFDQKEKDFGHIF